MNSIKENINRIESVFDKADLKGLYSFSEKSVSEYKILISKFKRIVINGVFTPYTLDDIHNIEINVETNNSAKYVSIIFSDGVRISFHKIGLSLLVNEVEYSSSKTVLGRLYYYYKVNVCGEKINPLIIFDSEVIAYCGNSQYVYVPEGVKKIGINAFEYSKIERIHLPNSLEELSEYCFYNCKNLIDISFGEEDNYIGIDVFEHKAKRPIMVSKHIPHIGKYSFFGCDNLLVE